MGITSVNAFVRQHDRKGRRRRVQFLVDSGAVYTVLPGPVWRSLQLVPLRTGEFFLADGTTITRPTGQAGFQLAGRTAVSPVILGDDRNGPLLGAVTLETLGFMLNLLTRGVLLPMRLVLA